MERRTFELPDGADAGRTIHFIDDGPKDAPVVVMLHGNPTWCFLWRKVIAATPQFRSIAPDLLGLGLSSMLPRIEDHSVERHVDALVQLLEALDLPRFILVGQDWGGGLLPSVGRRLPERVAGIVLANTSALVPKRPRGTAFHRFAQTPVLSDLVFRGLGFPQSALWVAQGDRRSLLWGTAARAYRWPLRRLGNRIAPLAMARMVPNAPDHPSVAPLTRGQEWITQFDGPMALVWGTRDPILGRALKRHEQAFPQAPVTRAEAGHFLQEQVPDALAAAIADVVQRSAADA